MCVIYYLGKVFIPSCHILLRKIPREACLLWIPLLGTCFLRSGTLQKFKEAQEDEWRREDH